MTPGFLAAGGFALAVAVSGIQSGDAIEQYRRVLQADPNDAAARMALKELIDRAAIPRDQDERVREILRQHPWHGRATLTLKDEPGLPLIVSGVVRDDHGAPIAGAVVSVFQTDANGHYTRAAVMDEPHARLFAFIRTGDDGRFEFTTIRPGAYPGRPDRQGERWRIPAHVHFHVTAVGHAVRTFQMVFDDDARMTPYWRAWAARDQHPIVTIVRRADGAQRASCDITLRKAASAPW
ncbi:MAG TPA: hypothetical protein VJ813_02135 [Vicinamibacterales bacterium]|nr:hypothetical protein [Vicinamibacterales bacterium]